jgi:uncharacterized protein YndB with AHSA1/START domain
MEATGGYEVAFHGEYREIVPDERIVTTEVYEAMPEGEALNTVTFTELDRRTTIALLAEFPTKEVRDMVIESGMELGMQEQMDVLEQVAISLR